MGHTFPLQNFAARMKDLGGTEVLIKHLSPNDNSKNQIYLAGDISRLGLLPTGDVEFNEGTSLKLGDEKRGPIFRAALDFWWLTEHGGLERAPHAKLILYPQYSEVRLSGFLLGCRGASSSLFDVRKRGREEGRVLLLCPLADRRVVAAVFEAASTEARALRDVVGEPYGVLHRFDLIATESDSSEHLLLKELRRIHELGWLDPVYLQRGGGFRPCRGTNCGGVTLESHLGITANGYAEPDFHGWEIKQHGVGSWVNPTAGRVTLMTPEPDGGAYVEHGPRFFVDTWGYADQRGRENRRNFGGVYRAGAEPNERTGLRLVLSGYDASSGRMHGEGAVMLVDRCERVAASWSFAKLIDHWKRKHAKAAFVPSIMRKEPTVQYQYGSQIALAEGGRFNLLLRAFACGSVYYDPGIKLEGSGAGAKMKRRSQFRIDGRALNSLYETYRGVDLLS